MNRISHVLASVQVVILLSTSVYAADARVTVSAAQCFVDHEARYKALAKGWLDDGLRVVLPAQCPPSERRIANARFENNTIAAPVMELDVTKPSPRLWVRKSEMDCLLKKLREGLNMAPPIPEALVSLEVPFCE